MNLQEILISTIRNIFFALVVLALSLPIILSFSGAFKYVFNLVSYTGIGE